MREYCREESPELSASNLRSVKQWRDIHFGPPSDRYSDRQSCNACDDRIFRNFSPIWTEIPKYPVIAGVATLAVGITIAWWAKVDISPLFDTAEIRRGQLWRLFTAIFPHLDILHLVFKAILSFSLVKCSFLRVAGLGFTLVLPVPCH